MPIRRTADPRTEAQKAADAEVAAAFESKGFLQVEESEHQRAVQEVLESYTRRARERRLIRHRAPAVRFFSVPELQSFGNLQETLEVKQVDG